MANVILSLSTMEKRLAACRFDPGAEAPPWAWQADFCSITRTADELSIICDEDKVPADVKCARDWRALKLEGPFDFALVGILASILQPLAKEGISVLAVGTYDTDYVLVRAGQYERAIATLIRAGHRIKRV